MSGPVQPPLTVETIDGATIGRPITKIKVTNGTLAVSGSTATITTGGGGGGSGTVTSVGLTETGTALTITGSPVTTSGTINIAGAGTSSQVILGDLSLGTLTSGTVTGTGSANQVSYWTSTSAQAGSTGLTYNPSTGDLTVGGYVEVGTKITTPTGTDLTLDTVNGTDSGSIVIEDGVNGQISITPDGVGIVKLGSTGNPVRVSNVYTLPTAVTTDNNYVLTAQTDGSTAWAASGGGGGGSPAGSNTEVQFNNSGAFGASSSLTFDGTYLSPNLVKLADGSNTGSFPYAVGFASDDDTGLYRSAANQLAFSTGGSQVLTFGGFPKRVLLGEHTGTTATSLSTYGAQDIVISTNQTTDSGTITITDGVNGDISLTPNGAGAVEISGAYKLPTAVTGANNYVLTAQTDGSTAWAASGGGGSGTVTVGTYAGNNNLAYFSGATEISNTNNISINATAGSGDFFGQLEASKHMAASDGTAGVPSFSFSNATNLGFFKDGSSAVSFTSGGTRQMSFDANGVIRLGGSSSKLTTYSNNLVLDTDVGTNSGSITINSGVNGNIDIIPDGTGEVHLGNFKFDVDQAVGVGQDNYVLTYDNASDSISLEAAGGGGSQRNYQGLLTPISTSLKTWDITRQTPFSTGSNSSQQFGALFNNQGYAFAFAGPQDGTPTELAVSFGSGSSGGARVAIYDSTTNGEPGTIIAHGEMAYSSNAIVFDTSLIGPAGGSASSMTVGDMYWCVMTRSDGTANTTFNCSSSGSRGKTTPSATINTAGNILETTSLSATTSFPDTAPAITSWIAQNTLIPLVGVRF